MNRWPIIHRTRAMTSRQGSRAERPREPAPWGQVANSSSANETSAYIVRMSPCQMRSAWARPITSSAADGRVARRTLIPRWLRMSWMPNPMPKRKQSSV